MTILGVDPGTIFTGFGVIQVKNGNCSVIVCDVLKNVRNSSMPERLSQIYLGLCDIIKKYNPDEFAMESSFYGKNPQSALKIGYARGVSILAAIANNIPIVEYSPREIKKAITGNGSASKQQVRFMVKKQLGLQKLALNLDASDALAVALCHSFRNKGLLASQYKSNKKAPKSWSTFVKEHPELVIKRK